MKAYIYKITNLINNKTYIGSTIKKDPIVRWTQHKSSARNNQGYRLHKAIRKYGEKNFKFEVISTVIDINFLDEIEDYFIVYYKCIGRNGYNIIGVDKGQRDAIRKNMIKEWKNPVTRKNRINKMIEGSRHKFTPIVGVNIYSGNIIKYESVHAAMRDGFAQSAIYFVLNGKDKTGQQHCWFRDNGEADDFFKSEALKLVSKFKTDFVIPIKAINIETGIERIFENIHKCSNALNIKVKNIRRHIKGDIGYNNHVKGYKFSYIKE